MIKFIVNKNKIIYCLIFNIFMIFKIYGLSKLISIHFKKIPSLEELEKSIKSKF